MGPSSMGVNKIEKTSITPRPYLVAAVGGAAAELEAWFTTFEDNAEGTLETRRTELQDRLVAARQGIEEGLAAAEVEAGGVDGRGGIRLPRESELHLVGQHHRTELVLH